MPLIQKPRWKIETERLRLRPIVDGDDDAVHALLSDNDVVRYMLFPRFTRERARSFVAELQRPDELEPRQAVFAMVDRQSDEMVGLCGLVLGPQFRDGEAWYLLHKALWGRGLTTEAVRALVSHGFEGLDLHRIWASCLPENPGSARVLEKLGFRREGLLRKNLRIHGEWRDSFLYAVLAEEWKR